MAKYFLGADVGSSSVKAGIFDEQCNVICEAKNSHSFSARGAEVDIEPEALWDSLLGAVSQLSDYLPDVVSMGLSVLCPNLICMDGDGNALMPGIIHLDRRSEAQGEWIADNIGVEEFRAIAGNVPCPGGMSVTSMLWVRENRPDVWAKTVKVGHTNTFLHKRLTGNFIIDPSNASFNGLYDTVGNSGWSKKMCDWLKIDMSILPEVKNSWDVAGSLTESAAKMLGLKPGIQVVTGGADTACAVFGAGCINAGDLMNTTGTVEALVLTTDKPFVHPKFLLRVGVLHNRWNSLNIIGAGGQSLGFFHNVFCSEMSEKQFYKEYVPSILSKTEPVKERFSPYLAGDRTCVKNKTAEITGLTLGTTRENLLNALAYGMIEQLTDGMDAFATAATLNKTIQYTGGGASIFMDIKKKQFPGFSFNQVDNCALIGVGKLIQAAWENRLP